MRIRSIEDLELYRDCFGASSHGIDERAAVHPDANIDGSCVVGPFAVIGPDVTLGPGCVIHPHAVLQGPTIMGRDNIVHPFACIGGAPQDLRHLGEPTKLCVGDGNEFREHVTVSRGTVRGGAITTIGSHNLFMAYSHVAHDCHLGSRIVMANQATCAGHAIIEDYTVFGGMVAVGPFVRIGESSMLGAGSMISIDVAPFCLVEGNRAQLRSYNKVGMQRRGISEKAMGQVKDVVKQLKSKVPVREVVDYANRHFSQQSHETSRLLQFLKDNTRGITR